jgi:hypothetical protein
MKQDEKLLKHLSIGIVVFTAIVLFGVDYQSTQKKKEIEQENEKQRSLAEEITKKQRTITSDFGLKCGEDLVIGSSGNNKIYYKSKNNTVEVFPNFEVTDNAYKFNEDFSPMSSHFTLDRKKLHLTSQIFLNGKPMNISGYGYSTTASQCVLLDTQDTINTFQDFITELNNKQSLEEQERQRKQKIRDEYSNSPNKF